MAKLEYEWMKAIQERDMCLKAMAAFLAAVDDESIHISNPTDAQEEVDELRRIVAQLKRKTTL